MFVARNLSTAKRMTSAAICGYCAGHVIAHLSDWPVRNRTRPLRHKADQAREPISRPIAAAASPLRKPTGARRAARDICSRSTSGGPSTARHDGMWPVTSIIHASRMRSRLDAKAGSSSSLCAGSIRARRSPTTYGDEYRQFFLDNGGCRCAACIRRKALRRKRARMRRALEAAAVTR